MTVANTAGMHEVINAPRLSCARANPCPHLLLVSGMLSTQLFFLLELSSYMVQHLLQYSLSLLTQ